MEYQHIEMSSDEIMGTMIINIIKMLTDRKFLDRVSLEKNIKLYQKKIDSKLYLMINNESGEKIHIKFFLYKLTTIKSNPDILEFLTKHTDEHMIFIVDQINTKVSQQFELYNNVEVFRKEEMMFNIASIDIVPEHIPLTSEEKDEFLKAYKIHNKKKTVLSKININDPMVRYFNMKVGDIVKIRHTSSGGYNINYRIVRNVKM